MNRPVQLLNMGDFEREFGGLNRDSEGSYAIQQFFLNGGTELWGVRVASGGVAQAAATIDSTIPTAAPGVLTVSAINEGDWGNNLRVRIERAPGTNQFNLIVSEYGIVGGRLAPVRQETFRNLSLVSNTSNFAERVVNDANTGSKLVSVIVVPLTPAADVPLGNGTVSAVHSLPFAAGVGAGGNLNVTLTSGGVPENRAAIPVPAIPLLGNMSLAEALSTIATNLQNVLRAATPPDPGFAGLVVDVVANRLRISANTGDPNAIVTLNGPGLSDDLLFTGATPGTVNIQEYSLGSTAPAGAQIGGVAGANGTPPDAGDMIGVFANKTGIYSLEEVDLFNILVIPRTAEVGSLANDLTPTQAQAVMAAAIEYCGVRRAFFVMDTPRGVDEPTEIKTWLAGNDTLRSRNAALYYPRVRIPDPLDDFRLRPVGASGTVAGLYARTDSNRGVWKAPAGTEASLRNVSELDDVLTDPENGTLNPLAINCLRTFKVYGNVCWGARTLDGSDQQASEWKYVPIRRLALYLEESLFRGTKWVVFEPNDEPLWAQIRLNVGAFMHNLFRQGALQGQTPREAYLVKCDKETTTQNDIDLGIVNILVGFAPLKPAEFVIIKIQQLAGQLQT